MYRRLIAMLLSLALLTGLAGCGKAPKAEEPVTIPTEPIPTVPADGNPNDVTCKGSYTVSDDEIIAAKDTVVATMEGANLTNSQLQIYYWLEVAAHRSSDTPEQPDWTQSLDTQLAPLYGSTNTWQQYFLGKALNTWHARQALALMSQQEGVPSYDPEYKPDEAKRAEYMSGMPATEVLYQWSKSYKPNRLHQAYLDAVPETLKTLAADNGFADTNAMAKAIAGAGAEGRDLISYTHTANLAYMYFTEMGYYFEPTREEIEARVSADATAEDKTVNIRHILLIPDMAEVAADGTVTANEDAWMHCETKAKKVASDWQARVKNSKYAQFTQSSVPESRFSEAAKNNSQDPGSAANGGLYVNLQPGQLLPELDAWCFDDTRQHGDWEIIRAADGWHIMFFSSATENRYADAQSRLIRSMYTDLVHNALEQYSCEINYSAIKLGSADDNGSFVTPSDLLYPDVAHERFPDMPLYLQQDYPDAPFGNYKLSTHGCGITTLAMVASYLADDELTPAELAARYGYYCGIRGSEIVMFDDTPAEMGFHLQNRSYSWPEMNQALRNGQVVVSLQWNGYWTRGGHYIAMIELSEDDHYVVRDSNLLNYKRIQRHAEDHHSRSSISQAGQYYWIYEPKVTSIPACVRCGGGEEGAPEILFQSEYHCEKCLTAMNRRDLFLSSLA